MFGHNTKWLVLCALVLLAVLSWSGTADAKKGKKASSGSAESSSRSSSRSSSSRSSSSRSSRSSSAASCEEPPSCGDKTTYLARYDPELLYEVGDNVSYSCIDGHVFEGTSDRSINIFCLSDGTWEEPGTCERINCGLPLDGGNTIAIETTLTYYTDTYKYACMDGFTTRDETLVFCQANGFWSSDPPQCTAQCSQPSSGENTQLVSITSASVGHTYTYSCIDEFVTSDELTIRCQEDGTWSGFAPICELPTSPAVVVSRTVASHIISSTIEAELNDATICAWLEAVEPDNFEFITLYSIASPTDTSLLQHAYVVSGQLYLRLPDSTSNLEISISDTTVFNTGRYHCWVYTSETKFQWFAISEGSAELISESAIDVPTVIKPGTISFLKYVRYQYENYGNIGFIQIWDRALSVEEIEAVDCASKGSLVSWYDNVAISGKPDTATTDCNSLF